VKVLSNAHTHTVFCDGENTPAEMAAGAEALGFTSLGFSSHSPTPFDPTCPGVADEKAYRAAVGEVAKQWAGRLEIACGMEQDIFAPVKREDYDYVIGSMHCLKDAKGNFVAVDSTPGQVLDLRNETFGGDGVAMAKAFFAQTVQGIEDFRPDIAGHFDLLVKFNGGGDLFDEESEAYQSVALEAADAAADILLGYGGIVEVNTGGMSRGYRNLPYPLPFLLRHFARRGVRVMINSDSHSVDTLNYKLDEALELVRVAGFGSIAMLQGGRFVDVKI
jgi:histidinol-phosphatase (PHP family)